MEKKASTRNVDIREIRKVVIHVFFGYKNELNKTLEACRGWYSIFPKMKIPIYACKIVEIDLECRGEVKFFFKHAYLYLPHITLEEVLCLSP